MSAYDLIKDAHSLIRWVVLIGAVWALVRVWRGFLTKAEWTKKDRIAGLVFTSALNLELLFGMALYITSPLVSPIFHGGAAAIMQAPGIRFFAVEHPFMMVVAVLIAQAGFSMSRRAPSSREKFVRATTAYTIAVLLILAAIPWPFLAYGRPLLPHL